MNRSFSRTGVIQIMPTMASYVCDCCDKPFKAHGVYVLISYRMKYEYHLCSNRCHALVSKIVNPQVQEPVALADTTMRDNKAIDTFNAAIWKAKAAYDATINS